MAQRLPPISGTAGDRYMTQMKGSLANPFEDLDMRPMDDREWRDTHNQGRGEPERYASTSQREDERRWMTQPWKMEDDLSFSTPRMKNELSSERGKDQTTDLSHPTLLEREQGLQRRERDLQERERVLAQWEFEQRRTVRPPNWPICYPIIHHDIQIDIPFEAQGLTRRGYILWYLAVVTYFFNLAGCASILFTAVPSITTGGSDFGISVYLALLIVPGTFIGWYSPLYNGCRKNRASLLLLFFLGMGFYVLLCTFLLIGVPGSGGAGIINWIQMLVHHAIIASVLVGISTFLLISQVVFGAWIIRETYVYFRRMGHTLQGAKQETLHQVGRSEAVQEATQQAVMRAM